MVPVKKWELRSIESMKKFADPSVILSFKQLFKIKEHAFGTLEFHCNGNIHSVGELLTNVIKCAIIITDLIRFKKGIKHNSFTFSSPKVHSNKSITKHKLKLLSFHFPF